MTLSIDIETYSSENLQKSGVYRYAEAPDFRVLLIGWSLDGGPVEVDDLSLGGKPSLAFLQALTDPAVEKRAFNAAFERVCLSRLLRDMGMLREGEFLPPDNWRCTMVLCMYLGLPHSLAAVGEVLKLDRQKLAEGKDLIRFFCQPGKNGRNLSTTDAERWQRFIAYNRRDVETEMEIGERLKDWPVPKSVWREYELDQAVNDRGIGVDRTLVTAAMRMDALSREELRGKLSRLTELSNPNSVSQIRSWLEKNGTRVESLGKKQVAALLQDADPEIREVLLLRQQLAKSSVKKYEAMANTVCSDGRIRGMFQFYGASRSGRWAGRGVQLQNLPQNHLPDLDAARKLVRAGDCGSVKLLYDSVPDVLSELIRTAFVPSTGRFIVADFSAIEARVLSWLAGEDWRNEVFASGGDIYCASASQMFHVPVEKHGVNGHLRQKGKVAELALGYGGGVGALRAMGALEMGVPEEELQPLVNAWRKANPKITCYWRDVDQAAGKAVRDRAAVPCGFLEFVYKSGMLFIRLPSGRSMAYAKPSLGENRFGGKSVQYMGLGAAKKWELLESYGPKFVENIVQGISRDLLAEAMMRLSNSELKGCRRHIVAHVHDEVIIEAEPGDSVEESCRVMSEVPEWAPGLILRADGYECEYYRKD